MLSSELQDAPIPEVLTSSSSDQIDAPGTLDVQRTPMPTTMEQQFWTSGMLAFDAGSYSLAIDEFAKLGMKAKALYNIAICHLQLNDAFLAVINPLYLLLDGSIGELNRV